MLVVVVVVVVIIVVNMYVKVKRRSLPVRYIRNGDERVTRIRTRRMTETGQTETRVE